MNLNPFKLERYFAEYEFSVRYLLSPSDCEGLEMASLLEMADPEGRQLWDNLKLSYTESSGHPLLRSEIAKLYPGLTPENILVAVPEEAIFIFMHTLLKPGDHIIAMFPAYQSLYEIARSTGCQVTPWMVQPLDRGWQLDLTRLEESITPRTRLLVINFPHNPTGCLVSPSELDQIVAFARRHGLYLFSDEMYRLLEYDPLRRLPSVSSLYEKAVTLSGLSKSFALPGLRLGWLATRDKSLLDQCQSYKDYTTICASAPSEILGIIALRAKETILARNLDIILSNLNHAEDFFTQYQDHFSWIKPHAGSVAFPQWKGAPPVEVFCQQVLNQQGVMIVPGSIFDYPGNHFRIGLGRKNFPEALEQVGIYLDRL
jgi:aspartate/methionine/tyrosine aminotransferase